MKHWLQSLSENGFDVFTVVYMAVLFIVYHYLLRWYFNIRFNNLKKQLDIINQTLNEVLDEFQN